MKNMEITLSALDKLVLHTIVSTLQVQRTQTIKADFSFLSELGYSDEDIENSLEKMRHIDAETALEEAHKMEMTCH